ncbi:Hypothetical predicted protein [Mytilus galloprovincialis]|uniref:Integrase catalytic domain-containing protein n=1 Tax=Mytilus galloprovincialis TaxID=29158 RepID=A0A8B6CUB5_MYTGA|nr:Hypothetical predicted protein [Mytilus galloprovincialis]
MYVELLIHDILVKFVVDTGATLTLVSTKVYDLIPDLYRPHLSATKSQIKSACGNYLNLRGTLGCFRVVSTESVTIPARSEIVVSGKVCLTEGQTLPTNDVLVEASENKGKDYILTARSLVKSNDSIPVRLMNVENEAKTIFPGTTIAQMCEISHVAKSLPSQNDGQNKKGLRSDLHDLLNRTSDKLSRSEKQKVKSLVQEYESLFAETDSDLGKTSLVKHEIETGNARPFKEPPRRTPFHLSKVVNDNIDKMLENKSKTSSDCHKTEESQVKIVTSQMPDHDTDWTLTDKQSNDPDLKHFYDNERKVVKLQAVIPLSERKQVLHFCHDAKYAGHLGMRKTLEKIRQSYYWPGLQADVRAYVAGCDKCAMRKTPTKKKRAPMAIVETSSPMERLATDILGELPETENGNRYILVVSDYYTKWTESFPMPNMEASTVVKIIVEVIARFGVPSWIHSDQGRQYESRIKLKHKQVLRGEMSEDIDIPQVTEPREADIFDDVIDQDDRIGIEEESGRRERKRPVWMADYILD